VWKAPEIFIFTFIILSACVCKIVGEGNLEVDREPERVVFEPVRAEQQVISGSSFCSIAFGAGLFQARQAAMPGQALAHGLPIAGMEGLEGGGRKRRFALGASVPRPPGRRRETITHLRGPRLVVERNESLEFA
jgi:hypothetical protein